MHHPTDRLTHTTAFDTPVVMYWLEREIAQWVHHEGWIQQKPSMELHVAPLPPVGVTRIPTWVTCLPVTLTTGHSGQ